MRATHTTHGLAAPMYAPAIVLRDGTVLPYGNINVKHGSVQEAVAEAQGWVDAILAGKKQPEDFRDGGKL